MCLKDALIIGNDCGLETVGEAITHIEVHSVSLFHNKEIPLELQELYSDVEEIKLKGFNEESKIIEVLKVI